MDTEIGNAAGDVYQCLEANGPATISAIKKATGLKDTAVASAIGWLARESKVTRQTEGRLTRWTLASHSA